MDAKSLNGIERVVPKRDTVLAYLIGVDQRMIQLGPIIEGFVENQNVCLVGDRIIICSSTRHNWDVVDRLQALVIRVNAGGPRGKVGNDEIFAEATRVGVGVAFIGGGSVRWWFCSLVRERGRRCADMSNRFDSSDASMLLTEVGLLVTPTHDGSPSDLADLRGWSNGNSIRNSDWRVV